MLQSVDVTFRAAAIPAAVVAALYLLLLVAAAPPAHAELQAYDEGPGAVAIVRPVPDPQSQQAATNSWFWRYQNTTDPARRATVCFRFRKNEEPWVTPYLENGSNPPYEAPAEGRLPARGCDPEPISAGSEPISYRWTLNGLGDGDRYEWCASEFVEVDAASDPPTWKEQAASLNCQTVRIDAQAPLAGIVLSTTQTGRQGVTNETAITRTITYADSVSPPWPDNRICRLTDRRCVNNGADPFDYAADCSRPVASTVTTATFSCGFQWTAGDQRVNQCVTVFDSAVADRAPDLTRPPGTDAAPNPDYRAAGSGNFAIACDAILVDRQAPRLTLRATPNMPTAGVPVLFEVAAPELEPGGAGMTTSGLRWDFGDGFTGTPEVVEKPTATGAAVSHTFARPGFYPVSVTWSDNAGNPGTQTMLLQVREIDAAKLVSVTADRRILLPKSTRVWLPLEIETREPGRVIVTVMRGQSRVAREERTFRAAARRKVNIRLERPAQAGAHEIRVLFISDSEPEARVTKTRQFRIVRRLTTSR